MLVILLPIFVQKVIEPVNLLSILLRLVYFHLVCKFRLQQVPMAMFRLLYFQIIHLLMVLLYNLVICFMDWTLVVVLLALVVLGHWTLVHCLLLPTRFKITYSQLSLFNGNLVSLYLIHLVSFKWPIFNGLVTALFTLQFTLLSLRVKLFNNLIMFKDQLLISIEWYEFLMTMIQLLLLILLTWLLLLILWSMNHLSYMSLALPLHHLLVLWLLLISMKVSLLQLLYLTLLSIILNLALGLKIAFKI